jgi:hypothetical protein
MPMTVRLLQIDRLLVGMAVVFVMGVAMFVQ